MNLPPLTFVNVVLAAGPILLVLYLMIGRNWGGSKAGPAGLLLAALLALLVFGGNGLLLGVALGRSLLLALYVLYVIWMALLLYHTVNEAGAITVIGRELPKIAHSQPAQALLLAWIFGSFLQGASGFGVPAAVVAPLLVGLGFAPTTAVVVALMGHGWAVTFGSLGSSFLSLIAATGESGAALAGDSALLLAVCCLLCGVGVLWASGGRRALREQGARLLVQSVVMGGVQWALAVAGFWTIAAFGAGLAGMIVAVIDFRLFAGPVAGGAALDYRRLGRASVPYLLLVVIIVVGQFALEAILDVVQLNATFPAVATRFGWTTAAGPGRSVSVFGHPGALLLYTSVAAYFWFARGGTLHAAPRPYSARTIATKTVNGSVKTTVSVLTLLAMAVVMQHAGMTELLAQAISRSTGAVYPLLSPFIGLLGSFMTGSNTNSNVVFGQLQQQTALALDLSVSLILAGQTAGGAIGSILAPAKVIVGCSTVEGTNDAQVLRAITVYGVAIVAVVGVLVWLLA